MIPMKLSEFEQSVLSEVSARLTAQPVATARLLMRPFRTSDLEDVYEYLSQKEQRRLSGNTPVESFADAKEVLDFFTAPSHPPLYFAIEERTIGKVIGNLSIGFYPFVRTRPDTNGRRGVSLSYVLNENFWRRGYMTELLTALYRVLFLDCELEFINSGYFDFNTASGALQKKLGMQSWFDDQYTLNGCSYHTKEMILWRGDDSRQTERQENHKP